MIVRVVLSIDINPESWEPEGRLSLDEVRGQVCASVANTVQAELDDYGAVVKEVRRGG